MHFVPQQLRNLQGKFDEQQDGLYSIIVHCSLIGSNFVHLFCFLRQERTKTPHENSQNVPQKININMIGIFYLVYLLNYH